MWADLKRRWTTKKMLLLLLLRLIPSHLPHHFALRSQGQRKKSCHLYRFRHLPAIQNQQRLHSVWQKTFASAAHLHFRRFHPHFRKMTSTTKVDHGGFSHPNCRVNSVPRVRQPFLLGAAALPRLRIGHEEECSRIAMSTDLEKRWEREEQLRVLANEGEEPSSAVGWVLWRLERREHCCYYSCYCCCSLTEVKEKRSQGAKWRTTEGQK